MNCEQMRAAGSTCHQNCFSDKELEEVMEAYKLVIAFLEGRRDGGLVISGLQLELRALDDMQWKRKLVTGAV